MLVYCNLQEFYVCNVKFSLGDSMAYKTSALDKSNFSWFQNDSSRASLTGISLVKGGIRGLTQFDVSFKYPITAFSGGNGSGKSTMLALIACGFHNHRNGFIPPLRNKSYYTFNDFFVQSKEENSLGGVQINYFINHNRWKGRDPGVGQQVRKKSRGGKWNDYASRVNRNVIYFGIQRVVPHYERSTHKSYRSKFKPGNMNSEDRLRIAEIAGKIIGKAYTDFNSYVHTKYTLPVASCNGISYSGFNMGAGEGSVFEILSELFVSGPGTLLVIDEIELGLHEQAQVRLVQELKKLCKELKCQIICSTHSHGVLRSLPPEARFHIENIGGNTFITSGASPEFACGKMGRPDAHEIDVFVEDSVAVDILKAALPATLRKRVQIKSIGSHSAVMRQMASRKLEKIDNCICILDGDQRKYVSDSIKIFCSSCECSTQLEREKISSWVSSRIFYLPGSDWPEKWIIETAQSIAVEEDDIKVDELVNIWGLSSRLELMACLEEAAAAEKHGEFRDLASTIGLDEGRTRTDLISFVVKNRGKYFQKISQGIELELNKV